MAGRVRVTLGRGDEAPGGRRAGLMAPDTLAAVFPPSPGADGSTDGGPTRVAAGGRSCHCRFVASQLVAPGTIVMPEPVLRDLRLRPGQSLSCGRGASGELRLGPVIAVLADYRSTRPPFGEQTSFLWALLEMALEMGAFAYVVTPAEALRDAPVAYCMGRGVWARHEVPHADVCYDRCLALTHRDVSTLSRAKVALRSRGVVVFNTSIGGKDTMHRLLLARDEVAPYLPETIAATHSSVARMLRKHRVVYVKPAWGTQGRSITRISRQGAAYHATTLHSDEVVRFSARSPAGVARQVRLPQGRRMLVQQGIDLLCVSGRLADVRVLVQKDRVGAWQVTGSAARLGKPGSPVSNLHQGASVESCRELLMSVFHSDTRAHAIESEVRRVALAAAAALETSGATLGELGIDMAVDRSGRVWFLEANPRPGRAVFRYTGSPALRRASVRRPMEYANYLATVRHAWKEQCDV